MPPFHLVDVFATRRYAGNQLAVVEHDGGLAEETMQAIAAEYDFSETTFVESVESTVAGARARVRIFTPDGEIPFAGHPTLGTAHVVRESLVNGRPGRVTLDLKVGDVSVTVREGDEGETLWMRQQAPEFVGILDPATLAEVCSLRADAVDSDRPVQVVSTGLPTIVVPLVDRGALSRIEIDDAAYDRVTGDRNAKNILAFCSDPRNPANDLAVRVFAPFYGVPEDPATGSSNGCLAGYLVRHCGGPVDARVEQGYELGRPSLVHLEAREGDGSIEIDVGGRVVDVGRGELI